MLRHVYSPSGKPAIDTIDPCSKAIGRLDSDRLVPAEKRGLKTDAARLGSVYDTSVADTESRRSLPMETIVCTI